MSHPAPLHHRLLITAGPTHEPIDAVRYLGNRSSGKLGVALAEAAAQRGQTVTLLLGPTAIVPGDTRVRVERFRTTEDLEALLARHAPQSDTLIMAAAVADFRMPQTSATHIAAPEKLKRTGGKLILELEPTPDLLSQCAQNRREGQLLIGFALEPADRLVASAQAKLERKGIDAIVANPLETMDSSSISATLFLRNGASIPAPPGMPKSAFAGWLLDQIDALRRA